MLVSGRTVCLGVAVVLAASLATGVIAQNRADPGSLEALTAEVHHLRLAVEEAARRQTQTQALSVYLSAQQSRLVHVGGQLESAQRELDAMNLRSRENRSMIARLEESLQRAVDPTERNAVEEQIYVLKTQQESFVIQQKQAEMRYGELSQAWHVEQGRWTELIGRLEGFTRQ